MSEGNKKEKWGKPKLIVLVTFPVKATFLTVYKILHKNP